MRLSLIAQQKSYILYIILPELQHFSLDLTILHTQVRLPELHCVCVTMCLLLLTKYFMRNLRDKVHRST